MNEIVVPKKPLFELADCARFAAPVQAEVPRQDTVIPEYARRAALGVAHKLSSDPTVLRSSHFPPRQALVAPGGLDKIERELQIDENVGCICRGK